MCSAASAEATQYLRESGQAGVVKPVHVGELKHKTLRGIMQDLKISFEEFRKML